MMAISETKFTRDLTGALWLTNLGLVEQMLAHLTVFSWQSGA